MNVLKARIGIDGKGYVVSPGYLAGVGSGLIAGLYDRIPREAFTLVVNRAVEIPVLFDLWMMMDILVDECPWYSRGLEFAADRLCVSQEFNDSKTSGVEAPYTFEVAVKLRGPTESVPLGDGVTPGFIRGGATTSAGAVQLLYQLGARKIVLCGVDMCGNKYYDGSEMPQVVDYWPIVQARFNALNQWIREQGVEVTSISETALDVPLEQYV